MSWGRVDRVDNILPDGLCYLLEKEGLIRGDNFQDVQVSSFGGDGSIRKFFRVWAGSIRVIAAMPGDTGEEGIAEAGSCYSIGRHLRQKDVPVPEIFGYDPENGIVVFEDLGGRLLQQEVVQTEIPWHEDSGIIDLYKQVVASLARMQVLGAEGFDTAWCWDHPVYDRSVMIEREAKYFLTAFCRNMLGIEWNADVLAECHELAKRAGNANGRYFLHRDFQSRNIMLHEGQVRFIDYQAGRLGPLGYDLASLLIDPYVQMDESVQEELMTHYLEELRQLEGVTQDEIRRFPHEYQLLSVQRNLQIIGAFSFLSQVRNKVFFKGFIGPALLTLEKSLSLASFDEMVKLRKIVREASRLYQGNK